MSPRDLAVAAATIYSRPLRAFIARHVDDPQDIDDVAQSTIVKVLSIANDTSFIYDPLGFLFRVASWVLADRYERRARDAIHIDWCNDVEQRISIDVVANSGRCPSQDPEDQQHNSAILQRVLKEIGQMSSKLSAPLALDLLGYTQVEIAKRLGFSKHAVKKNLQRARTELEKRTSAEKGDDHR